MVVTMVSKPGSWLLDTPLTKYELLVSIDEAFASLARELSRVEPGVAEAPPPGGGWSVADHLAHLAGWEALELARVEGRSGAPEVLAIQVDSLRRRVRGGACARAAWNRLEEGHRRLRRAVWDLPEGALRRPWHPTRSFTLAAELATNTFEHYREHLARSRAILGRPS